MSRLEVLTLILLVFQILHGFKTQVGEENWRRFVDQFPANLSERLVAMYEI